MLTRYTLLLTDDETGEPRARVSYRLTPYHPADWNGPEEGDELMVEEIIPAGYKLTDEDELRLRHHAERLALETPPPPPSERFITEAPLGRPIKWGVKG